MPELSVFPGSELCYDGGEFYSAFQGHLSGIDLEACCWYWCSNDGRENIIFSFLSPIHK